MISLAFSVFFLAVLVGSLNVILGKRYASHCVTITHLSFFCSWLTRYMLTVHATSILVHSIYYLDWCVLCLLLTKLFEGCGLSYWSFCWRYKCSRSWISFCELILRIWNISTIVRISCFLNMNLLYSDWIKVLHVNHGVNQCSKLTKLVKEEGKAFRAWLILDS